MSKGTIVKKILILAANPKDTPSLRLEQEVRDIEEGLERAQKRDQFIIVKKSAVRPRDFRRALMEVKPHVVHFCGHGLKQEGIVLENEIDKSQLVSAKALSGLFELFSNQVRCVVLNACFSQEQAEAIGEHIDYVVGMSQAIGDRAAIEFSVAFYDALAAEDNALESSESVEFAYRLGCAAIDMAGISGNLTPVLLKKQKLLPSALGNKASSDGGTENKVEAGLPASPKFNTKPSNVFISYRSLDPDIKLAQEFHKALEVAGHHVFMAAESIRLGDEWPQRIDAELQQCDYFLLLLSPQSATSEMVTAEVQRVKRLRDTRPDHRPSILPIRVNFSLTSPLNYDLRGYLQYIQQREWNSDQDTLSVIQEVLALITEGRSDIDNLLKPNPSLSILGECFDLPPLPVAEPELPEGQVDLVSKFYVERPPIESRCYETILKPGALIRIKAPRQMGKTSLMARILYYAGQQDYKTVPLSFQLADESVFSDLDQFLQWFCASITSELDLCDRITDFWQSRIGSKMSCTNYFERYLLKELDSPIAVGLDEVDLIFQHSEIASNFFGLLRAWHEKAKSNAIWKKLRLVVVHSTEVYIPLNMHQSPFNVGLPIELPEFNVEQVLDLAYRHGLSWDANQVNQLMAIVGGHPYLIREALYHITRQDLSLEQLLQTAPTEAGLFGDHLRRHWWNLSQHLGLAGAIKQVVSSKSPVRLKPIQAFQLHSMGLVHLEGNEVSPRCDLYRQYFGDRLQGEG